ncbi:MAG: hypothetical protein ACWGQW_02560 [bacterium]
MSDKHLDSIPKHMTLAVNGVSVTAMLVDSEIKKALGHAKFMDIMLKVTVDLEDGHAIAVALRDGPPPPPEPPPPIEPEPHDIDCQCQTCRAELEDGEL